MTEVHRIFISYHHTAEDRKYKTYFDEIFEEYAVSRHVDIDDSNMNTETVMQHIRDEYLRDSTVTIVLLGPETWKRKFVDWEIAASIRNTEKNPRSGLLGILLPNYPSYEKNQYNRYTIPPRLFYNLELRINSSHGRGLSSLLDVQSRRTSSLYDWI